MGEEEIDEVLERMGYGSNCYGLRKILRLYGEKKHKFELGDIDMRDIFLVTFISDAFLMSKKR